MIILIDNGHGSDVKGKHSPILSGSGVMVGNEFKENDRFREWKYTRVISDLVVLLLKDMGYDARLLVPETNDVSLGERVRRTNNICSKYGAKNVILVSIHANAVGNGSEWMNGKGWEAYSTVGKTISDDLAECLYKRAEENFKNRKIRKDATDGDSDKESNFYIIKNANCAAVLTENFFYDNKDDLEFMVSEQGIHEVVRTHVEGIADYVKLIEKK